MKSESSQARSATAMRLAERIHSVAIRLLRRLRGEDRGAGVSAPALSALSVIVFNPGLSQRALAQAEQISAAALSRVVSELERDGLIRRDRDPSDARVRVLSATAKGRERLTKARARRVGRLTEQLDALSGEERDTLSRAAEILERLVNQSAQGS